MKILHLKLFYLLFGFSLFAFGQTLEKTYISNGDETLNAPANFFFIDSNLHFFTVTYNNGNDTVKIYDSNHNEAKSLVISNGIGKAFLFSNNLFNSDDKIEFLATVWDQGIESFKIVLFNEDGTQLFDFGIGNYYNLIKDKDDNYKLLISEEYHENIKVYGLSGTLSSFQENISLNKITTFPNPSSKILNISNLKKHNGLIEVYTIRGKKVLTKKVDKSLEKTSIDISSLSKGVYFYRIGKNSNKFIKN